MQLEEKINNLLLIDHFLVKIDETTEEITTKSGIVLPGNTKTPNFGVVLKTPTSMIIKEGTTGYSTLSLIKPGDTVFFPVNVAVNYLEFPEVPAGIKLILLNKDHIQAIMPSTETSNEY